jgi:3-methyladenine DNA glycosylase AlkD
VRLLASSLHRELAASAHSENAKGMQAYMKSAMPFFVRKAIGWALRAYAWTDPAEVTRYVRGHESQLSALSRREALENIDSQH